MLNTLLTTEAIDEAMQGLTGWEAINGGKAIHRTYSFHDFSEAFAFMTQVALVAEKMDHHPEWFNVYRTVDVTLSTHSAGGVTRLDLSLARRMDEIALHYILERQS
ncbi:MAG: 4a-hydroxytetrahydrobiopterin dehydratase [Notoacmeibacter sp.]|nr:4a-hydroxytetrahydrobiopterin dehydratase [Notoacmeibacter sp.]